MAIIKKLLSLLSGSDKVTNNANNISKESEDPQIDNPYHVARKEFYKYNGYRDLQDKFNEMDRDIGLLYSNRSNKTKKEALIRSCYRNISFLEENINYFERNFKNQTGFLSNFNTFICLINTLVEDKKFDEAITICDLAIKLKIPDKTKTGYEGRKRRILSKKNKSSKENNLYCNTYNIVSKENLPDNDIFSNWHISLSFGKSTSVNYERALFLAKNAPFYNEFGEGKSLVHQAVYTSSPVDFNNFSFLYEIVGSWKSSFVFINGKRVTRKDLGKLKRCYYDRCNSPKEDFCFGAYIHTENPFGCHRLQVSRLNSPWWSFGKFDNNGIWHVDKNAILEHIKVHMYPYANICPAFDWNFILDEINKLPDTINPRKDKKFMRHGNYIYLREDSFFY